MPCGSFMVHLFHGPEWKIIMTKQKHYRSPKAVTREIETNAELIASIGFYYAFNEIPWTEAEVPYTRIQTDRRYLGYTTNVSDVVDMLNNGSLTLDATIEYERYQGIYIQSYRDMTEAEHDAKVEAHQKYEYSRWKLKHGQLTKRKNELEAELAEATAHVASLKPSDEEREFLRRARQLGYTVEKIYAKKST